MTERYEEVDVLNDDCPIPGCKQPGPHKHGMNYDEAGALISATDAKAIEGMELEPMPDVKDDNETKEPQPESEH